MSENESESHEVRDILEAGTGGIPEELPILALDNFVLYPFMIAPVMVHDETSRTLIDEVVRGNRMFGAFVKIPEGAKEDETPDEAPEEESSPDTEDAPSASAPRETDSGRNPFDEIPRVGVAAAILKMLRIPDGSIRLLVHGVSRVRIQEELATEPFLRAKVEIIEEEAPQDTEASALMKNAQSMLQQIVGMSSLPDDLMVAANNVREPGKLADLIASNLSLPVEQQQEILETINVKMRLKRILEMLNRETQVLEIGSRIQSEVKTKMDKTQKDYLLREQLRAIKRELGEEEDGNAEVRELREQVEQAALPDAVREAAEKELSRLDMMTPAAAEYIVVRNYLDWILALPWMKSTQDQMDIIRAQRILDEDHYDLEKIKERILEYLSVIKLRETIRGPILCFVGPPGVGKTSLGKSIARALDRKFYRISLGGMRDEAEIRGHRRTYIGAMPGRIISGLKNCDSNNPVIMLDEIDKLGSDVRGDPASALLEVLDPEQNSTFTDHYLDLPFDLSKTMFITTANVLDTIPGPLLDRMEVLHLSGYTYQEKLVIARRYLIPRAYENSGIGEQHLTFTDEAIARVIDDYTREAGLRNLERELTNICRKVARKVAAGEEVRVEMTPELVPEYLGPQRFYSETAQRTSQPGVATGLAWTPVGGEILFIEASDAPGNGNLTITGQIGEVMKESAMAARSYIRANHAALGIDPDRVEKRDVHLHIPAGAIRKDGPSAGVALTVALVSLMTGRHVKSDVAMTGEITLKGNVLPVGGVKEKVLAAHRAGIKHVFLPARNEKDLDDLPEETRKGIEFTAVERIDKVLEGVFEEGQGFTSNGRDEKKKSKKIKKSLKQAG